MRTPPLVLAAVGGGLAVVAVVAFAMLPSLLGPQWVEGGQSTPPQWAGNPQLDASGVYDSDADGLPDALENQVYGTNPTQADSAGSGIPDGWLVQFGFDPLDPSMGSRPVQRPPPEALPAAYGEGWPAVFTPTLLDVYSHGRPAEWNESQQGPFRSGLDPTQWDSNGDGIPEGWALHYGLDPLAAGLGALRLAGPDGLTVQEAFRHNTDPRKTDTDGDGLADRDEIAGPRNPTPTGPRQFPPSDPSRFDTTGSGVCDGYMVAHGLDPTQVALALGDIDADGATTLEEFQWSLASHGAIACSEAQGVNPTRQRSGASTIPDGWLLRHGLDPFEAGIDGRVTQSAATDPRPPAETLLADPSTDLQLTVLKEYAIGLPPYWNEAADGPWWGGTDPSKNDTDGDGLGDAWEIRGFLLRVSSDPLRPGPVTHRATSDPTRKDTDGDGLHDGQEANPAGRPDGTGGATDPRRWDTDFDGIDDGTEVGLGFGLDPAKADSVGDLLRDGIRFDMLTQRAAAYAKEAAYEYPGQPGKARNVLEVAASWGGAANLSKPLQAADLARLVGPGGDADGDRKANLMDRDMDNDGLDNGLEVDPSLYWASEFGMGSFTDGRPATDPLNPDTDGDRLPDGWEVKFGQPGPGTRSNLDPSKWDSNAAGISDGEQDLDDDGVRWMAFIDGVAVVRTEAFSNFQEYQFKTNPNRKDSDRDGLADGWKVFWGLIYPGLGPQSTPSIGAIYPGAPGGLVLPPGSRPTPGQNQSEAVAASAPHVRFVLDATQLLPGETAEPILDVQEATGGTRTVYRVEKLARLRYQDVQDAGTNPYLLDTDGDDMPDWWEVLHASVLPGSAKSDKSGSLNCAALAGPSPLVADGLADPDQDGLSSLQEFRMGTDPLCRDSDGGSIWDGEEPLFGLDPALPTDDYGLLTQGTDTDGDGLVDFEEIAGIRSISYGIPGTIRTRFDNPDTDGDGLLDGDTVPNPQQVPGGWSAGHPQARRFLDLGISYYTVGPDNYFFRGEKGFGDPRKADDCACGLPSGWLVGHGLPVSPASQTHQRQYRLAMPSWWDLPMHGPWWGGVGPSYSGSAMSNLENHPDLDNDGLKDFDNGAGYEDPFPAANTPNQWRAVDFAAHGLTIPPGAHPMDDGLNPEARRMLAQAFLSPRNLNPIYGRNPPPQDTTPRQQPCLQLDAGQEGMAVRKGIPFMVTGQLSDCANAPLTGVTVEVRAGNPPEAYGANFTDAGGRFSVPVNLTAEHEVSIPPTALVFRGNTTGTVRWETNPASIPPGGATLGVRSYATPAGAAYAAQVPPLRAAVAPLGVKVYADSRLALTAPAAATTGRELSVSIRLTDLAGSPLQGHKVEIPWGGETKDGVTSTSGEALISLPIPHAMAGLRTIAATSTPPSAGGGYVTGATASTTVTLQRPANLVLSAPPKADAGSLAAFQGNLEIPGGNAGSVPVHLNLSLANQVIASGAAMTGLNGKFTLNVAVPATAPRGQYVATATAAATEGTQSSRAQATLAVRSIPRFAAVETGNLTAGSPLNVSARLVEPDGATPLANAAVTLELDGVATSLQTDAEGRLRFQANRSLPLRPVLQKLSFAGDDTQHLPATHRAERTVLSPTHLAVTDGHVGRGLEAHLEARLMDGNGRGVGGAWVAMRWGEDPAREGLTDPNGVARFTRLPQGTDALGSVPVRAVYAGSPDRGLAASSGWGTWGVQSAARLWLPNGSFELGVTVPPGTLTDAASGAPLGQRVVRLSIDGAAPRAVVTDERGRFEVLPAASADQQPHRARLQASYAGDAIYGPVESQSLVDRRAPTTLRLRLPGAVVAGRESFATATVLDGQLLPVGSGEVRLSLGGKLVGSWPVVQGAARLNFTLPTGVSPGPTDVEASYSGDASYSPATERATLGVLAPVDLVIRAERAPPGQIANVQVSLASDGRPLPFTPLYLAVGGTGSGLAGTTDRNGVATFQVEQTAAAIPLAARFAGDPASSPALAYVTLEPAAGAVGAGLPFGVIALAVAASLGVLAAVGARLRRKPLGDTFRRIHRLFEARGVNEQAILLAYRILEDGAIAHALLPDPALTARDLERSLRAALPARAHGPLAGFIQLFEDARYGPTRVGADQRRTALHNLDDLLALMDQAPPPRPRLRASGAA